MQRTHRHRHDAPPPCGGTISVILHPLEWRFFCVLSLHNIYSKSGDSDRLSADAKIMGGGGPVAAMQGGGCGGSCSGGPVDGAKIYNSNGHPVVSTRLIGMAQCATVSTSRAMELLDFGAATATAAGASVRPARPIEPRHQLAGGPGYLHLQWNHGGPGAPCSGGGGGRLPAATPGGAGRVPAGVFQSDHLEPTWQAPPRGSHHQDHRCRRGPAGRLLARAGNPPHLTTTNNARGSR